MRFRTSSVTIPLESGSSGFAEIHLRGHGNTALPELLVKQILCSLNPVKSPFLALVEALFLLSHRLSSFSPFLIGLSLSYGPARSVRTKVLEDSVKSLSRVLLLLLIYHDADDEAAYAAEHAEEEKEEELEAGHGRWFRVIHMI